MNTDVIARWRDAATDPPQNPWKGTLKRDGEIFHVTKWLAGGCQFWANIDGDHSFRPQPGDQWLDVTDVPAVAVAKVQAAVDAMKEIIGEDCVRCDKDYHRRLCASCCAGIVSGFTGVKPSEVQ